MAIDSDIDDVLYGLRVAREHLIAMAQDMGKDPASLLARINLLEERIKAFVNGKDN